MFRRGRGDTIGRPSNEKGDIGLTEWTGISSIHILQKPFFMEGVFTRLLSGCVLGLGKIFFGFFEV